MTFKVTESGWYRTRDGRLAECLVSDLSNEFHFSVFGYISGVTDASWRLDGRFNSQEESDRDLVEYLGKERPAQKKVVRMAPVLCRNFDGYWLSDEVYASEETARVSQRLFIRWLIDTPYELTVEVPDNG